MKSRPHGLPSPCDRCRPGRQTVSDDGLFNPTCSLFLPALLDAAGPASVSRCAFPACQDFVNSPVRGPFLLAVPHEIRLRGSKSSTFISAPSGPKTRELTGNSGASGLPLSPSCLTRRDVCVLRPGVGTAYLECDRFWDCSVRTRTHHVDTRVFSLTLT